MADDRSLTALLKQLDGIANAPMTAAERELRAQPLLAGAGVTPGEVLAALQREELTWNQEKAREYGVPVATWIQAIRAVQTGASETLGGLLYGLHRAESAAAMLRAGAYPPAVDAHLPGAQQLFESAVAEVREMPLEPAVETQLALGGRHLEAAHPAHRGLQGRAARLRPLPGRRAPARCDTARWSSNRRRWGQAQPGRTRRRRRPRR